MVGMLWHDDQTWGLLKAPDGVIHRIRSGNYQGQNNGKVTEIMEANIELLEVVQDQGRWRERPASLALAP
jgi:type IV pilus assembly protein PilP